MKKITIPTISFDALITLKVSGFYYKKLTLLLLALGEQKTQDDFKRALATVKENDIPKDPYDLTVNVIMQMIYEIEHEAKLQNLIKDEEIEVDDDTTK